MAEKVDDKTAAGAGALPVSVKEEEEEKKQQQARASPLSLLPAVTDVVLWTLFDAASTSFSTAFATLYIAIITTIFSHPPSWLLPGDVEMADDDLAVVVALMAGILWCATPAAAAGVLALMLPSHRRRLRLFLAYAALLATVASHCMQAAVHRIFAAADLGGLFNKTVGAVATFVFVVVDILCVLGLVLRGGEE